MNSELKKEEENPVSRVVDIIQLIFSISGLLFYLIIFVLLNFYYKCPSLIKKEIFFFIFIYSIIPILEVLFPAKKMINIIGYFLENISFYLIISYTNKCLTSKKLSKSTINFELIHRKYLYLILAICSFPLCKICSLSSDYFVCENVINILVSFVIYKYIKNKFQLLLDYLNERKVTNSKIPDIYLPYMKAYFYYTKYKSAYSKFFLSFILIICSFALKIAYIYFQMSILCYVSLICEKFGILLIIYGSLFIFFALYKNLFGIGKNEENEEEGTNISNFTVIDVDIQHEDKDNNSQVSKRKKKVKKNVISAGKELDNNYVKIEGEEIKENEKDKENNIKAVEEEESLNK